MTINARKVLADCEFALERLEHVTTDQEFRIYWFAALGLVRTVGDVLNKIDGRNRNHKAAIAASFENWKDEEEKNKIFWCFIKKHRDLIIHEYKSLVDPSDTSHFVIEGPAGVEIASTDDALFKQILSGPWENEDARDVLSEAIDWWKHELDKIDIAVLSNRNRSK